MCPRQSARIDPAQLPSPLQPTEESASHHDAFVASYKRAWADVDYSALSADEIVRIRHHYAALVERLDADVGTIVEALATSGRLANSIVVFASDHGDYLGDFGLVGKTYFHEPSVRVPLIVTDFRSGASHTEQRMISLLDLYPSILQWAGVDIPAHADGKPLSAPPDRDRIVVGMTTHGIMARSQDWKLVRYRNGVEALYDLVADPTERHTVIAARTDVRAALDAAMIAKLLDGFAAAHADKRVAEAQAAPEHAFYRRGWPRPYPSQMN